MPEGPFIDGNSQFLGCANFENVPCLSKGMDYRGDILLYNVSKIGLNCNIKIGPENSNFNLQLLFKYFFKSLDGFLNLA
mgnify:CR=1 FL=1|jgi:hypothetical protein